MGGLRSHESDRAEVKRTRSKGDTARSRNVPGGMASHLLQMQSFVGNAALSQMLSKSDDTAVQPWLAFSHSALRKSQGPSVLGTPRLQRQPQAKQPVASHLVPAQAGLLKEIDDVEQALIRLSLAGKEVSWNLYRALLQLQADLAYERHGRMLTDKDIRETVLRAKQDRIKAEASFSQVEDDAKSMASEARADAIADPASSQALLRGMKALFHESAKGLKEIGNKAFDEGKRAESGGHLLAARDAFLAADAAELAADPRHRRNILTGVESTDWVGTVYTGLDTGVNLVLGGTLGNLMGGLGSVSSTMGTVATGFGAIFGPLGMLCGGIDSALNIKSVLSTNERRRQMEELSEKLADPRARQLASFVAEQKERKFNRRLALTGSSLLGFAAGLATAVALGVATAGIGALALGVLAAAIGLGFLFYRMYRRSKRAQEKKMRAWAQSLVDAAQSAGDQADRELAIEQIKKLHVWPSTGNPSDVDVTQLAKELESAAHNRREQSAESLLDMLINGSRSERHDAETILEGLKADPAKLIQLVENGNGKDAIAKIKAKLQSW